MPIAHANTIAAHDRSKSRNAEYVAMYWPRLARGAAKYSPTIAPIVASVTARRSAVKMYGRAFGTRSLRNTSDSGVAYERSSSSDSGSTVVRPRTVLMSTGKKQRTAATIALESWLSRPNQLLNSGAKARIGTELAAT